MSTIAMTTRAPAASAARQLADAEAARRAGRWQEARGGYLALLAGTQGQQRGALRHNLALCCLALGDAAAAAEHAAAAVADDPQLWQAGLVRARALKQLGQGMLALEELRTLPQAPEVQLEIASLSLHELGDAALAQSAARPLLAGRHPRKIRVDAQLTLLMARLYERSEPSHALAAELRSFAGSSLMMSETTPPAAQRAVLRRRPRLGLISPQFCCSPVYFFCIGALRLLRQNCDLVFFDRGGRDDWARQEFRSLASDWFEVGTHGSEALAAFVAAQSLDCLIDLGGWMDPVALRALSTRPARKLYKWVGGQSATTGLQVFDGMFSDAFQAPANFQPLYSEPLVQLAGGYVSYTPPPYMPDPVRGPDDARLGIISHPAKISRAFIDFVCARVRAMPAEYRAQLSLVFVDRRYRHDGVRQRLHHAFAGSGVPLHFIAPSSHREYLQEVGRLSVVLDTFPYSGGLTTMEALSLGVPCLTRTGVLFSERHTYSHCRHAGLQPHQFDLDQMLGLPLFQPGSLAVTRRPRSLVEGTARTDHAALAQALRPYVG